MSFRGSITARMPRIGIGNLLTGEQRELPFTPTQLTEQLTADYSERQVLGLSHRPLQYSSTSNYTLQNLEFFFRSTTTQELRENAEHRRFLMSLCYPSGGSESVVGGGAPRILFLWPKLIAISCVMRNLSLTHTQFNIEGDPVVTRATFTLTEIRDTRISSDDIRQQGTIRGPAIAQGTIDAAS